MRTTAMSRLRRMAVSVSLLTAALVGSPTTPLPAAQAVSLSRPTGLIATVSANSVSLRWKAVKGAPAYRVQFSTRSDMETFTTMDVVGTSLEWNHLDSDPAKHASRLRPHTSYYFRVKVISLSKVTLTHYSRTLEVTTASAKALPDLPPVSLRSTARSATSMYLSWSSRGPGVRYRIRYGRTSALELGRSRLASSGYAGTVLSDLLPATRYYFKVRVMSATGGYRSGYSVTRSFTTPAISGPPPVTVATYNVCSTICDTPATPWADSRKPAVVANVAAQSPDVVSFQELDRRRLTSLVDDLNTATGRAYRSTDPVSRSSGTTRLLYDSARFSLASGAHGVLPLSLGTSFTKKYAVWAILTDTRDQQRFFVVATHLIAGHEYVTLRKEQAEQVVALVRAKNVDDLPVVLAGDFNSSRNDSPNPIYDVLSSAGYREPLGNLAGSWTVGPSATAEHRIDLEYNTFNNFETYARRSKYPNGTAIDYIWHSAKVRVAMAQVVVAVDTERRFVGTIPSDHNLFVATVHLR